MKYYSYDEFIDDAKILSKKLRSVEFDGIIAIARGGLALAQALSYGLDIRNIQSINAQVYEQSNKLKEKKLNISCTFDENIKKILVVDDICDSGETLSLVMSELTKLYTNIEFYTATIFYKHSATYKPHYHLKEANEWIDFCWEREFL